MRHINKPPRDLTNISPDSLYTREQSIKFLLFDLRGFPYVPEMGEDIKRGTMSHYSINGRAFREAERNKLINLAQIQITENTDHISHAMVSTSIAIIDQELHDRLALSML